MTSYNSCFLGTESASRYSQIAIRILCRWVLRFTWYLNINYEGCLLSSAFLEYLRADYCRSFPWRLRAWYHECLRPLASACQLECICSSCCNLGWRKEQSASRSILENQLCSWISGAAGQLGKCQPWHLYSNRLCKQQLFLLHLAWVHSRLARTVSATEAGPQGRASVPQSCQRDFSATSVSRCSSTWKVPRIAGCPKLQRRARASYLIQRSPTSLALLSRLFLRSYLVRGPTWTGELAISDCISIGLLVTAVFYVWLCNSGHLLTNLYSGLSHLLSLILLADPQSQGESKVPV